MEYKELNRVLHQYSEIYLYGAGVIAFGVYKAIQELFRITVKGFLVTGEEGHPQQIERIPVIRVEKVKIKKSRCFILIATPEEYHDEIVHTLKKTGFFQYIKIDAQMEYALMGAYLKRIRNINLIEDYTVSASDDHIRECQIYMAISHKDKCLQRIYKDDPWIRKVQAGAALTRDRISEFTDEGSDSLSEQNGLYGELTVTYYIWKYNDFPITGLFHYRRVLEVTKEQLALLWKREADVILPLPFVCTPDASGQYGRYLLPGDINIMLEVLQEKEPDHFGEIEEILKMPYLYNYNVLIARKEVFDDYCSWLFPLLEEIARRCEKEKRDRKPRYIGRVGEVLTSVYFMRNKKRLRIVHAKKTWRV